MADVPADLIIPPMIEVSRDTGSSFLERIKNPKPPTVAIWWITWLIPLGLAGCPVLRT